MSIGADLLAVPFGDMILSMATAIAQSQKELDKASLVTLKELAGTHFKFIENITEVLTPNPQSIPLDKNDPLKGTIMVTGVDVQTTPGPAIIISLLQAGFTSPIPTLHDTYHSLLLSSHQATPALFP